MTSPNPNPVPEVPTPQAQVPATATRAGRFIESKCDRCGKFTRAKQNGVSDLYVLPDEWGPPLAGEGAFGLCCINRYDKEDWLRWFQQRGGTTATTPQPEPQAQEAGVLGDGYTPKGFKATVEGFDLACEFKIFGPRQPNLEAMIRRLFATVQNREAELAQAHEELHADNQLLAERDRLLAAIPECEAHGPCVPHAIEWVERSMQIRATLEAQEQEPPAP